MKSLHVETAAGKRSPAEWISWMGEAANKYGFQATAEPNVFVSMNPERLGNFAAWLAKNCRMVNGWFLLKKQPQLGVAFETNKQNRACIRVVWDKNIMRALLHDGMRMREKMDMQRLIEKEMDEQDPTFD